MKIIPKLQKGGGFDSLYTIYTPGKVANLPARASSGSSSKSNPEEKEKLTEKDFFSMIKEMDGLPNEMLAIVNRLSNAFNYLDFSDTGGLANMYLNSLYLIKVASQNKKKYDDALKEVNKAGALGEAAITLDGKVLVQSKDGKVIPVEVSTYLNNKDLLFLVTNSNLAYLRAYSPKFNYDQDTFNILNNSIGFESFQALLDKAKKSLGSNKSTTEGYLSTNKAELGLQLLLALSKTDAIKALGSITVEGLYKYVITDENQKELIESLLDYIVSIFPERAKTWAALKLGTSDKDGAVRNLALRLILAGSKSIHDFKIDYKGTEEYVTRSGSKSGSGGKDTTKEGPWRQLQAGHGGSDLTYMLLVDKSTMSVTGKYYGNIPKIDSNTSLTVVLQKSGMADIVKNSRDITFGNLEIPLENFDDIMVNSAAGMMRAILPMRNGKVWTEVLKVYTDIQDTLKLEQLEEGTEAYNKRMAELLKEEGLDTLIDSSTGLPNKDRFGVFIVLEGVTSDKVQVRQGAELKPIKKVESDFIVATEEDALYDTLNSALSTKERPYNVDKFNYVPGDWFGFWDKLYKANIYIPINDNPLSAANADGNKIAEQKAYEYEAMVQTAHKRDTHGSTSARNIN